jgi:AmmeMemoRadiSam system protein A
MQRFPAAQRALLLAVARAALINHLVRGQPPDAAVRQAADAGLSSALAGEQPAAELLAAGACFVTLWLDQHGDLRGCRGEFAAHQPLLTAVGQMTLAAALDDPRFAPVTGADLPRLRIEISVLTPLEQIQPQQIEIGRHGLLIVQGSRRGLLLPSVPVEHHMQRDEFLAALCAKAGLPADAWRDPATALWSFETEAWEEGEQAAEG